MLKVTVICYLSSLLSYGIGFSKILDLKNAVTEQVNTYDYTINVSLATVYFVLAIFFAVSGALFFYVKNSSEQEIIETSSPLRHLGNRRELDNPEKVKTALYRNGSSSRGIKNGSTIDNNTKRTLQCQYTVRGYIGIMKLIQ